MVGASNVGRDHAVGMPRRPAPLPLTLDGVAFSVAVARDSGLSRSRLRASDLSTPHRGVRTTGSTGSTAERARAFLPLLRDGDRFSHVTAAELLGMRLPSRMRNRGLHVTAPAPRRAPQVAGVTGHQSGPTGIHDLSGLPVSPAVTAWLECAALLTLDEITILGDGLMRRVAPIASIGELAAAADGHRGRRGHRKIVAALDLVRPGSDSARETELRLMIVRAGLPEPEVNGVIRNRYGARIAHGDLVFRQQRVLVEYDGAGHLEEQQFSIDTRRLNEIGEEHWRIIRVDKHLFARRNELLRMISAALADAEQRA